MAYAENAPPEVAIEDIVVTANRVESLASKTPTALSVLTSDNLRDQGISDPTRLADAAPSLSVDRVNGNGLQITIRGVTSADVSEKGDPSAAFLSDGVYIARPQAQETSLFDLERVEVLRGPQGTLYGRNTTAGLINAVSARPKPEFQASADITYGNYDTVHASGMINLPVGDSVAVRAAVNYNRRDSYILKGASAPSLNPGKDDLSFRLGAKFDFGESVRLYVKGDYSTMKGNPTTGVALANFYQMPILGPAPGQRGATPVYRSGRSSSEYRTLGYTQGSKATSDNDTWGLMGELEVDLSDSITATYVGSYREFTRDEVQRGYVGRLLFGPFAGQYPLNATFEGDYKQQSHELRFAYNSDRLKAQAGVYYFREESGVDFLLFGTRFFQPGQRGYIYGFSQHPTISKTLGFFGQGTFSVTDTLRLTAGIRHTSDDKSRLGNTINHANLTDPLDYSTGVQPGTTNPGSPATGFQPVRDSLNNASVSYSKVTWKVGVDYDLTPDTLLYGSVSTGYKAGGFNEGCLAGQTNCNLAAPSKDLFYKPETLTSYEIGIKANLSRAVRLSANYFHYDYSNLQLSQIDATYCGGPCLVIKNAGKAKIDGVEMETTLQPTRRNRFSFAAVWMNARYTSYQVAPGVEFKGEKLDRSPTWTASAGYEYTLPIGEGSLVAGVRTRISDSYHLISTGLRGFFRQPSYTKTDLLLTYNSSGDRFYVQGYVKNIEDNITLGSTSLSANFPNFTDGSAFVGDPRTYGLRIGVKF
ncbi:TonB-dependent receptor [Sphingobium fluviale]|uniref:TonB-dependent receptor n=1 Tax=Sphingobium fluviale TaxID=2506423 RepID=UPI0013E92FBE|nr:TonB-dependent receptor [Sphingobium fluviale]